MRKSLAVVVCLWVFGVGCAADDQARASRAESPSGAAKADSTHFDHAALEVTVLEARQFGAEVGGSGFTGSVAQFGEDSGLFDSESSSGTLRFTVKKFEHHLDNAEAIARYAWRDLFGAVGTEAPFPCGWSLDGEITAAGDTTHFTLEGGGDGGGDSCTGYGGPGAWFYGLEVTLDPETKTGTITYESGEE